jgi:4-diphosphocytidyl-2-C-methyl-D-erythritol kinase
VVVADGLSMGCDDPSLPTDEGNLVLRAALALRKAFPPPGGLGGARLELRKRIPAGAGLGGGSSDAAGALLLLSRLWRLPLEERDLQQVAVGLGADVPFFLRGGTARGTGRGDQIHPLPFVGEVPLLVGTPPFPISTATVYRRYAERLTPAGNDVRVNGFSYRLNPSGEKDLSAVPVNDLEQVVFHDYPELRVFRDALRAAGARSALLSGSGSSVFGTFRDPVELDDATTRLVERFERWTLLGTRATPMGVHLVESGAAAGGRWPTGE